MLYNASLEGIQYFNLKLIQFFLKTMCNIIMYILLHILFCLTRI